MVPAQGSDLVVGIASSALFDLTTSDAVFRADGRQAYREHQLQHLDDPLEPGVAFPFVQRLLGLNDIPGASIDVIVMSRNSPETGLRVMRSIAHHKLGVTRAVFREGRSSYMFMPSFHMSLFLSANPDDVKQAVAAGHAAGTVLHGAVDEEDNQELRVAFDFDGVLADDSSEQIFAAEGLPRFADNEQEHSADALPTGPLAGFLRGLNRIQEAEDVLARNSAGYSPRLRISLVTARNAPAHERAINSLSQWGLHVDDAFFLGGLPKAEILNEIKPHLFFDDQRHNLDDDNLTAPAVHVPFGIRNQTDSTVWPN